jgi:uncharacterized protein
MKKLLCLDGGGIRGILPARFVQKLEELAGRPARALFDMIAGTSTGGIIATGLFNGLSAKEIGDFYTTKGPAIFPGGELRKARLAYEPLYDAGPLETALADLLGPARLSQPPAGAELFVPSYCVNMPDNFFFRSWRAREEPAFDFALRDVARATSAAPIYFASAVILNARGGRFELVDGGVFANNPSLCALDDAARLWPGEKMLVVSIGTGDHTAPFDLGDGGAVDVGLKIIDILTDSVASMADHLAHGRLGKDYRRFEIDLATPLGNAGPVDAAMDDASTANLARLELLAERLIEGAGLPALAAELLA